jgi:hypothetical protein
MDAVKMSMNLIATDHCGVVTVQKTAMPLGFVTNKRIQSPRIVRAQGLGPNRIEHAVRLHSLEEVDEELVAWLRQAYLLQS